MWSYMKTDDIFLRKTITLDMLYRHDSPVWHSPSLYTVFLDATAVLLDDSLDVSVFCSLKIGFFFLF